MSEINPDDELVKTVFPPKRKPHIVTVGGVHKPSPLLAMAILAALAMSGGVVMPDLQPVAPKNKTGAEGESD
jgi:hypothetical protein